MISCNGITAYRTLLRARIYANATTKNKASQVEGAVRGCIITDSMRKVTIATRDKQNGGAVSSSEDGEMSLKLRTNHRFLWFASWN